MGMRSEWKHNRKDLVTKLAVTAAVGAAAFALFRWSGSRGREDSDGRD